MKRFIFAAVLVLVGFYLIFNFVYNKTNSQIFNKNMKIELPDFEYGGKIPQKFTCDGADVNPRILISDVPEGTKSLSLIIDDPDSPTSTWIHWIVKNISPDTKEIPENSVPPGAREEVTTFGKPGYGGPCPGSGEHRYFFKLSALDENSNEIARADWMGKYSRSID